MTQTTIRTEHNILDCTLCSHYADTLDIAPRRRKIESDVWTCAAWREATVGRL